ncbi:unnamed protein product, partial [Boreogadus saida]
YTLRRYQKIRVNHPFFYASHHSACCSTETGRERDSEPVQQAQRPQSSLGTDLQCHLPFSHPSRCPNLVMPAPMKAEIKLSPPLSWVGMRKFKRRGSSVP